MRAPANHMEGACCCVRHTPFISISAVVDVLAFYEPCTTQKSRQRQLFHSLDLGRNTLCSSDVSNRKRRVEHHPLIQRRACRHPYSIGDQNNARSRPFSALVVLLVVSIVHASFCTFGAD